MKENGQAQISPKAETFIVSIVLLYYYLYLSIIKVKWINLNKRENEWKNSDYQKMSTGRYVLAYSTYYETTSGCSPISKKYTTTIKYHERKRYNF